MKIQGKIPVISGLSVDDIVVGVDNSQIVRQQYGLDYDELNHNNYSIEMRYNELGLSFYYLFDDPLKIIFNINIILNKTSCIIAKFMVPFYSLDSKENISYQDVVNLFGGVDHINYSDGDDLASIAYSGISFHAVYDELINNTLSPDKIIIKQVSVFKYKGEV